MRSSIRLLVFSLLATVAVFTATKARGQSYGVELHNTLMPASGGMGGTSIARPQDLLSAINANPAAMSQFEGTQFTFSGAWAEANVKFTQSTALPLAGVSPYSSTSSTPGVAAGNIGLTRNFESWGKPITFGLGLISGAGGGVDFRRVPQSNGTSSSLLILQFVGGMSVKLTDRLAVGATASIGQAFYDAPFSGIGAMTPAYGARGSLGVNYQLTDFTTVGAYYQSQEQFVFRDAVGFTTGPASSFRDVPMGLPDNIGFGVANSALMDGRLLLALDVIFKEWDNADLYKNLYNNQWVIQTGAQYSTGNKRLRLGYAYAENPVAPINSLTVDGIPIPGAIPAAQYLQAQVAVVSQHRISAGFGVVDVLPGVNFDTFAGWMFQASQDLGATNVSTGSYYLGAGITWRFGGCCGNPTTTPSY